MGIYDRDYERDGQDWRGEPGGVQLRWPQTAVSQIILISVLAYVVQLLGSQTFSPYFELHADWVRKPWFGFQLLTYGFLHSMQTPFHLLFNMYGLWLFGRELESRYGWREFLTFYLSAIILGGVVWTLFELPKGSPEGASVIGASGAVTAVTLLYVFHWPERQIFLLVLPAPMWLVGLLVVLGDVSLALRASEQTDVAWVVHLTGAAFATTYYFQRLRLSNWFPDRFPSIKRKPKLRVHSVDDNGNDAEEADEADEARLNEILGKINRAGQDSLTRSEKKFLEQQSRKARERRSKR